MALSAALQKLVAGGVNRYSRSSGSRIKPKEGVNRYRILLPDPNAQFWADLGVHWIKPGENDKPMAVVGCPSICFQQPSEIATAIDAAVASAIDEESKKLYESWKARSSVLLNVLDRSKGSTDPDTPQILELTPTTFGKVLGIIQEYAAEGDDVLDAKTGIDITIARSGKGLNTEYSVNIAPGQSKPVTKQHLEGCNDLQKHIEQEFFRGDEQKALNAIAQIAQVDVPRIGSVKTPTKALTSSAAAVDEDDDALADVNDEVEEVEEAPVPVKKKAAPAKAEVEPEPESDDEDDLDAILAGLDD